MNKVKKIIAALILAVASLGASAKCITNDAWTGQDKTQHAVVGAFVGAAGTMVTKEAKYGVLASVLIAGAKEAYDSRGNGTCSLQDFAVTVAAGTAAAYGVKWMVLPKVNSNGKVDGLMAVYTTKF